MTNEETQQLISTSNINTVRQVSDLAEKLIRINTEEAKVLAEWRARLRERYDKKRSDLAAKYPEEVRRLAGVSGDAADLQGLDPHEH